jgi:hypothetical protein
MNDIEKEIEELEREAADMITGEETRYVNHVKATLLRNGFRIQQASHDARVLHLVHIESQRVVELFTAKELLFARYGAQGWVDIAKRALAQCSNSTPA